MKILFWYAVLWFAGMYSNPLTLQKPKRKMQQVTAKKLIREMDSDELVQRMQEICDKGDGRTPDDFEEYQHCVEQFGQLNGGDLPPMTLSYR